MGRRLPLTVALVALSLLATAAALNVEPAGACSCAGLDPRDRLAAGTPAVTGEVVSRRQLGEQPAGTTVEYTVRVERAYNASPGSEIVITSGSNFGSCGFTWTVGERVGAFLDRGDGGWTTNLCSLVEPAELERALEPYPKALGHGRVALLAGGSFTGSRLMALDRRGRVLGYGLGGGDVSEIAVCPGSRRSAELVRSRARTDLVAIRDLRTLRIVHSRRAPKDTGELRCASRSGTKLFAAGVRYTRASPRGRVRVVRLTRSGARVIATVPGDTVALARGAAYAADSAQILAIDLADGGARRLALFPDAGSLAPSPDGTRLAVSAARHGVRVIELATGRTIGHAPAGQPVWSSQNRLLVRGVGRPRLYDSALRPQRRLPSFRVGSQAAVGDLVFGVDGRRLVSLDLRRARRALVGLLPDEDTFALEAVPGAPLVRTRRVAPAPAASSARRQRCRDQPS